MKCACHPNKACFIADLFAVYTYQKQSPLVHYVMQQQCNQTKHDISCRCQNSLLSIELLVFSTWNSASQKLPLQQLWCHLMQQRSQKVLRFAKTIKAVVMRPRWRQLKHRTKKVRLCLPSKELPAVNVHLQAETCEIFSYQIYVSGNLSHFIGVYLPSLWRQLNEMIRAKSIDHCILHRQFVNQKMNPVLKEHLAVAKCNLQMINKILFW